MTIIAAADGSALGNPGPAGWAWYVDDNCWRAGGWPHGTNNQGELMAVLDLFRATAHVSEEQLHILCDSQYVINCVTKWMPGWKRKGWRKADGKPVLNVDLLREIDAALKGRHYEFEWVKGHAGHDLNEAADQRARAVSTAYQNGAEPVSGPGFPGQLVSPEVQLATQHGAVAAEEQPDLFSSLEEELIEPDPADTLRECDRVLFRADPSEVAVLLAEDFEEIGVNGRFISRDAVLAESEDQAPVALEPLSASVEGDTALLLYRATRPSGSAVQTSIWRRTGGQWRLRLRQSTPEQD
ncbi:ribonuclease HI [Psychromicrobium silvestre]|uniref:Ribonuclease H n=1 Tax=Psychromicrobium silvestre TaxID=1645614 RepID=A0A7Y9LVI2_9MICC|nr:ribonuclease HI family protein [Psychromicrobium silvestre]NYE96341.1 ribonuclease HI [Psychromicrobium silvestre]